MSSNPDMQKNETSDAGMRIRINIPADDKAVIAWINEQHDRSMSIRMIIRDAIEKYGMRDFFATGEGEIQQRNTPGPKPNAARKAVPEQTVKQRQRAEAPRIEDAPPARPHIPSDARQADAARAALRSMMDS